MAKKQSKYAKITELRKRLEEALAEAQDCDEEDDMLRTATALWDAADNYLNATKPFFEPKQK